MELSEFDFNLPNELIAQQPVAHRDASRLLVYERASGRIEHLRFADITGQLPGRTRFFRNNVAVLKARLHGERPTGGKVECLLLHPADATDEWWCLLKPGRKTLHSETFGVAGEYRAQVLEAADSGRYRVRFECPRDADVTALAVRLGVMPLPPYIERDADDPRHTEDSERYQTVYADPGQRIAAAAPTAGLHFTNELLLCLERAGHRFFDLTLQVGLGTFQPMKAARVEAHQMHREWYRISKAVLDELGDPAGGPRVAVGTTAVRTIESALRHPLRGAVADTLEADTSIFLYPPAEFAGVDALITNFHLPKSTLMCLVAAFLAPGTTDGIQILKELYALAVMEKYRFFSYGDAMLIL